MNRPMGGWLLSHNVTMPDRPKARPFLRLSPANEKKCPSWLNPRIHLQSPLMPVLFCLGASSAPCEILSCGRDLPEFFFFLWNSTPLSSLSSVLVSPRLDPFCGGHFPGCSLLPCIYLAFMWQNQHKNTQSSEWRNQTLGSFTAEDRRRDPLGWECVWGSGAGGVSNQQLQWSEVLPGRWRNKTAEWSGTIMQWSPRYPAKCANQNLVYQINTCGQQIALPGGGQKGVSKGGREQTDKRQSEGLRATRLQGTSWVI